MDRISLKGKIISVENGAEASLIIPVGDYNIMVLNDDNCGQGKGEILRSKLFVYHMESKPSESINKNVFGYENVTADSETLSDAMFYCQRKLRHNIQ